MRLTKKKFEDIIVEIVGTGGIDLINHLKNKKNISEFELANVLKNDIKIVRKLLYKLYDHNLVDSTRKKDKQKGWYIYYWTLLPENVKHLYKKMTIEKIQRLKEKLKLEETEYYFTCQKRCVKLDFNRSLDFEFKCPECGDLICAYDPKKNIKLLKTLIEKLEKELKLSEVVKKKVVKKDIVGKKPGKKRTKKKIVKKKSKKVKKKAVKRKKPTKRKAKKGTVKKKVVKKKKPIGKQSKKRSKQKKTKA